MTIPDVIAFINANITSNGVNGITGDILNSVLVNMVNAQSKIMIVAGSGYTIGGSGLTLTGAFFSNTITEIVTDTKNYVLGADFTQTGTTISMINGSTFYTGQVLIAKM